VQQGTGEPMNRSAVARRYAPLALLVVVQLVLVLLLPSTAPSEQQVQFDGDGELGGSSTGAFAGPDIEDSSGPGTGLSSDGGSSGPVVGQPDVGQSDVGQPNVGPGGGDTSHCVAGRQFDPAIDFHAPPCAGTWGGGNNGGSTYQGVTADTIKVVEYEPQSNPAVESIAQAAGLYVSPEQRAAFRDAAETFLNNSYEMYGRKIQIEVAKGTCSITPPDIACLRNDFRRIITDMKPFAVFWIAGGCSACFDEMSQLKTLNLGGMFFTDRFAQARAPYHWDVQQSGTTMNASIGQFWCANLAHKNAEYALHETGSMNGQVRKLGVIGLNDPEMEATVQAAKAELAKCDDTIAAEYYYAADLSTAAQQVQAGISKMRAAGVTSIYYLNDIAGPGYFMGFQQQNRYFVENIMSGAGTQDNDESGRQLQTNPIACPNGPPCPFQTAFGLSVAVYEPLGKDTGARVWRAAGRSGDPPYHFVTLYWDYLSMLGTMVQSAGPNLTPQNIDDGVRTYGMRGDADHVLRGFPRGSYTWGHDMGMQYWDENETSPYDGLKGAWVKVGSRNALGAWSPGGLGKLPNRG
jgi:hypothetical protein